MTQNIQHKICAIVAHDAGGAEIISSYVRRNNLKCLYALDGPAYKIFERKLGSIDVVSVDEAVARCDWILAGSSWQSELEFDAIKIARALGKKSAVFLDHWVNYKERFERKGELNLPNELWVGDLIAEELAKNIFLGTPVFLIENPYLLDIQSEAVAYRLLRESDPDCIDVLYVCEPLSAHAKTQYGDENYFGYTEMDAIRYFFNSLKALEKSLNKKVNKVLLRPHPSESVDKYEWVLKDYNYLVTCSSGGSLVKEIMMHDVVVGCSSMAMVVGLFLNKFVISSVPPGNSHRLPHKEINSIPQLIGKCL